MFTKRFDMASSRAGVGVVLLSAALCTAAAAQEPPEQPTLDELLRITPRQPEQPATNGEGVELDPSVVRRIEGEDLTDQFRMAMAEMREAAERLGSKLDVGLPTQRIQESVLTRLDQVIEEAKRQQQQKGGGGSSQGQPQQRESGSAQNTGQPQPGGSSANQTGAAGSGQPPAGTDTEGAMQEGKAEWGSLPARLREELLEGLNERYSDIYRDLTEAYYRRLAEESE